MRVVVLPPLASTSNITFEMWIGASLVMMPPVLVCPVVEALVCRLTRLTPSTITRSCSLITSITEPVTPLSLPAMTLTWSPFLMLTELVLRAISEHLRCERNDAHELLVAKLTAYGTKDARATRVAIRLKDDGGVLVELDVRTIRTTTLLDGAHDDSLDDFTLLDVSAR